MSHPVTYTAKVTGSPVSPTTEGTVAFKDGATDIVGCGARPLSGGEATCVVTYTGAGTHGITATYSGDATFLASHGTLSQQVDRVPTTETLSSSANASLATAGRFVNWICGGAKWKSIS